ncbi:hypothetical protein BGZ70_006388 [Mortierella alpina]|uniref:Uncharacterized protein n=1 Tax=Mortierella alpina TaxID=64518 RepID=A0A9P6J8G3_MORAP|nr:hypothetical protein BGZ70_006388 [Mortierella alpina]
MEVQSVIAKPEDAEAVRFDSLEVQEQISLSLCLVSSLSVALRLLSLPIQISL